MAQGFGEADAQAALETSGGDVLRAAEALLIQQEAQEATARQLASAAVGKGIPKDRVVRMLQEIQAATGCGTARARELLCEANLDANSAVRAAAVPRPLKDTG